MVEIGDGSHKSQNLLYNYPGTGREYDANGAPRKVSSSSHQGPAPVGKGKSNDNKGTGHWVGYGKGKDVKTKDPPFLWWKH